ncbi:hypothetical protein ACQ4M4_13315 [Leptolyngbya sp. AN02str]|uniref:hypothetical protein n=1 Tax=Leptolyngbya sp. AN02str TaxID=3423363 RepID=UPI003D318445
MGLSSRLFGWFRKSPPVSPVLPVAQAPIAPTRPKTLAELERQMALEAQQNRMRVSPTAPVRRGGWKGKLMGLTLLVGLPTWLVWVANLPYAPIRNSVADNAPMLLLPSYIRYDNNFREAIALSQQAKQLIDNPTSPTDLDRGQIIVAEAQDRLDALPVTMHQYWDDDWYRWHGWYGWSYSPSYFNNIRTEVGRLQATVAQEQTAQTALTTAEQAIATAKQSYQQAQTPIDQQSAIAAWREALQSLELIPRQTLAGRNAEIKHTAAQQEFHRIVGIAAASDEVAVYIASAMEFAKLAAQQSQNPPHSVEKWREIERLWQEAIARLNLVSQSDLQGYAQAQRKIAEYEANLGQIRVRQKAEYDAMQRWEEANRVIQQFQQSLSYRDRNYQLSQLDRAINELKRIPSGTSVYKDVEVLLIQASNAREKLLSAP